MCGIVGIYAFGENESLIEEKLIDTMRDTMIHRGPDGAGTYVSDDGRIGLGHRRLSIIDLSSSAAQPMTSFTNDIWIVFNGEIYNHRELRLELEGLGHIFLTDHSDTEVIINSFLEWGIDCVSKFIGMFAFAIWDSRDKNLWLVRDRIGIKPLYFSLFDGRIAFASEIKALLADTRQTREIDEEGLFHYLSFLTVPAPYTMFKGISKLNPGTWLRLGPNGLIEEKRYWDALDNTQESEDISEKEYSQRVLEKLRDAIEFRKVADVPVGIFLSGGVDSSANATLFAGDGDEEVMTFSVGYDREYESYQSELKFAGEVAESIGATHKEIKLNRKDLESFLPDMVMMQDEPIADPVCIPLYYVAKLARENGVTVCQVGEGADELYWGYPYWKRTLYLQRLNDSVWIPNFIKRITYKILLACGFGRRIIVEMLRRAGEDQPIFWGGAEAFTHSAKMKLLAPKLRTQFQNITSWKVIEPIRSRFLNKRKKSENLNWMTYLDLNLRLPELLLMRVDKMTMAVGLEARVPFLDHRLVEHALAIPESIKTRQGKLKYLLKSSLKGVISDRVMNRKKQGFGLPLHDWLIEGLDVKVRGYVDEFVEGTGLLDPRGVAELFESNPGDVRVWFLFNLALWWKHYFTGAEHSNR